MTKISYNISGNTFLSPDIPGIPVMHLNSS